MSDDNQISRREAIKTVGIGVGVIATLPVLGNSQELAVHDHSHHAASIDPAAVPQALKFFTPAENRTVIEMSERIIPADDNSPGAKAANVAAYIDLVVSESTEATKETWREGLAAISKISNQKFAKDFADLSVGQQNELLSELSKNERNPQTTEERFFRTIKYATVDGYYTSEIGIKQELHYKGNSYLKEFTGCTHPEHQ